MIAKYLACNARLLPAIVLIVMSNSVFAADCPSDIKAVTNKDADVPVDVLAYRVQPLTKCELEVEAQAWILLLKEKVTDISNAEVAAIYKKDEIKKAEEVEEALEDVKQAKEGTDREETKEAAAEVKEALKEAKDAEKKSAQDKTLQKAVEAARSKAKDEGETLDSSDKSKEAKADIKTALI